MSRKVIGMDLGGTKLLGGVVDEQLEVHDRVHRLVEGLSEQALVEAIVEAATELLEHHPDVQAIGFGIPCLIDQRDGHAVMCVNLPLADLPFRDVMSERLGLPVFIDNDANVATLVEQRFGAARGADYVVGLTIGTGIGGGLILDGSVYRGHAGLRRRARPHGDRRERPALPGQLPQPRLPRGGRVGHRDRARGQDRGRGGLRLRPRARRGRRPGDHRASWSRSWRSAATRCRAWCSGTSAASSASASRTS